MEGGANEVTIELLGVPRRRSGRSKVLVSARTAREALERLAVQCPGLKDVIGAEGEMAPHYLLSLDGRVFLKDLGRVLEPGERLLLLSADAGG